LLLLSCITKGYSVDLTLNTSALLNGSSGLILLTETTSGTGFNPAYLKPGLETGVTHLFGFQDLPLYTFHAAIQKQHWGLYLGGSHLAHSLYRETTISISVSYHQKMISIGSSYRLMHNTVRGYHNSLSGLIDAGIIFSYDSLKSGFAIRNLSRTRFEGQLLPVLIIWETNYIFSEQSSLSFGIEKERDYDFSLKIGGFYRLHPYIALISSYQYDPDRVGAGMILLPEPLRITYSIQTHEVLNPTHFLSVSYGL